MVSGHTRSQVTHLSAGNVCYGLWHTGFYHNSEHNSYSTFSLAITVSPALGLLTTGDCFFRPEIFLFRLNYHAKGILNVEAYQESRVLLDSSKCKLNLSVFLALLKVWGLLQIGLFAMQQTQCSDLEMMAHSLAVAYGVFFLLQWGRCPASRL